MTVDGDPWSRLRDLDAYRITGLPRRDHVSAVDPERPARAAALTAAYHGRSGPVAFGWIRTVAGGPVHLITAGGLHIPGGVHRVPLPPGSLGRLLDQIGCWQEISVVSDGLLEDKEESRRDRPPGPTFEDMLLGSHHDPFGWIVAGSPLPAPGLEALAADLARRLHLAEGAADRFPDRAVEARRLTARHAEVRRGASSGFWTIRLAAGARDPDAAARVVGLLCGAAGLEGLPYTLVPGSAADLAHGSTELLAALARPPETEIPGVRMALRPEFDVTPDLIPDGPADPALDGAPEASNPARSVRLGDILDRNLMPAGPFSVELQSLNRHVFVCGSTGAGKSYTVRALLASATEAGIPWLVVEPAKAEYRHLSGLDGAEVIRVRPGEADAIAAGLNPLEPAVAGDKRFPLQTHADLTRALFIASFRSEEPFPQVMSAALTRVYEDAGWDLALGEPRRPGSSPGYPALADLQRAAETVVGEIGYSQRVTDDVLGFIRVRIASLRAGTTGRFLEGGHRIDFARLLRRNVVLEIEDVGDDRDKAFLMGTVLIRLTEHLRLTRGNPELRHLTVIEEAHRLLRRPEPGSSPDAGAHAVELFAGMLAEIRAYGEGLIIAEQIPARIIEDVAKNSAVKLVHRLPAADDRDAVGATMNVTEAQSRYLVTLPPGQAAAFTDGMDSPILVQITNYSERVVGPAPPPADCAGVVSPRSGSCDPACAARPCTLREMTRAQRLLADLPWLRAWAELAVAAHLAGWPMPVPMPSVLAGLKAVPERLAGCAVSHAVDAAVAARSELIADAPGLAAHAVAAVSARTSRDAWLCPPQEPQWRVPGPVTKTAVLGVVRPSVLESASAAGVLASFVDCRWPARYL